MFISRVVVAILSAAKHIPACLVVIIDFYCNCSCADGSKSELVAMLRKRFPARSLLVILAGVSIVHSMPFAPSDRGRMDELKVWSG